MHRRIHRLGSVGALCVYLGEEKTGRMRMGVGVRVDRARGCGAHEKGPATINIAGPERSFRRSSRRHPFYGASTGAGAGVASSVAGVVASGVVASVTVASVTVASGAAGASE